MKVTVRFFAILRDRAGTDQITIELSNDSTIANARDAVSSRLPELRELMNRTAFAVNREYVSTDTKLCNGDELTLIPPVSGG